MSEERLLQVVTRLEQVVEKLSKVGGSGNSTAVDDEPEFVEEFDKINQEVTAFEQVSAKLGGDIVKQALLVKEAFAAIKALLIVAGKSKEPEKSKIAEIMKPITDKLTEIKAIEGKSKERDNLNHLKAVAEMSGAFLWPGIPSKPANHVKEMIDAGQFYSNRVLKDLKDKPNHKEWVSSLIQCFKKMETYVQEWHTKSLTWNPRGGVASVPTASINTSPAASVTGSTTATPSVNKASIFSAINQGAGLTAGLKKVDDSQKTHKNPSIRAGAIVSEKSPKPVMKSSSSLTQKVKKPAVFALVNKKWAIENQENQPMMEIKNAELSQTAYIYNCFNTVIIINDKINSVTLESCNKCSVILKKGIISSIDLINSKSSNVQADDHIPTISLDGCDNANIYLSELSYNSDIVTSKVSGVNIHLMKKDSDPVELYLAEQHISKIVDGKLVTEPVHHA